MDGAKKEKYKFLASGKRFRKLLNDEVKNFLTENNNKEAEVYIVYYAYSLHNIYASILFFRLTTICIDKVKFYINVNIK